MKYWLYSDGNILGPYEPAELLAAPDFTEESLVCDEDSINASRDDWKPASQFPEFSKILEAAASGSPSVSARTVPADIPDEKPAGDMETVSSKTDVPVSHSSETEGIRNLSDRPVENTGSSAEKSIFTDESENVAGIEIESFARRTDSNVSSSENRKESSENSESEISGFEKTINEFDFNSVSLNPAGFGAEKSKSALSESRTDSETQSQEVEAELVSPAPEPAEDDFPPGYTGMNDTSSMEPGQNGGKEAAGLPESEKNPFAMEGTGTEDKKVSGPVSMLDFLASLENILGEDKNKKSGADKPTEEINDFQKEVSRELGGEKKERNVKEELDSVRLEKDLLLGQISLQEMNEGNIRQRISALIQTFKSNAHRQGGKSVFDDDPNPLPEPEEMSRRKLPVKKLTEEGRLPQETDESGSTNFADGFISDSGSDYSGQDGSEAIETEIDDSYAETIKSYTKGGKRKSSDSAPYDVSNDSQGRPPIYFYELKNKETEPERRESVTKVSLSEDFRSGQIDFEPDEEDQTLNLLPQQAGGIIYDFTTLSGKTVKTPASRKHSSSSASVIDIDSGEHDSSVRMASTSGTEKSKQDKKTDSVPLEKQKDSKVSDGKPKSSKRIGPIVLGNSGHSVLPRSLEETEKAEKLQSPAMSGIRSAKLSSRSSIDKTTVETKKPVEDDEGPLLEEINADSNSAVTDESQSSADTELASMDDEDRLLRETYEAIMAGKDPAMLSSSTRTKKEELPGVNVWEEMFDSGNLLQAASIESIGKNSQTEALADDANPFRAADIYATPQQNVQADTMPQDVFPTGNMMAEGAESGTDFLNISPVPVSSADPVEVQNDFSDYYVNDVPPQPVSVPQETAPATDAGEEIPEEFNISQEEQVQQPEPSPAEEEPAPEETEEPQPAVSVATKSSAPAEEAEHATPKIIKNIPASISSIHRSIEAADNKDGTESELEQIPDFNVELASLESNRTKGPAVSSVSSGETGESSHKQDSGVLDINPASSNVNKKEENLPPALELAGMSVTSDSSSVLPQFEINTSKLRKNEESTTPAVNYYSPNDRQEEVKATVSLPVEQNPVQYIQPENRHREPAAGTLSTVLNSRVKNDEPPVFNAGRSMPLDEAPERGRSNKLLVIAMGMIICLLCGVILLFVLGGSRNAGGNNIARGNSLPQQNQPAEEQPDNMLQSQQEAVPVQPEQQESQNQQQPESVTQQPSSPAPVEPAQEEQEQTMEPVKVAPPVTTNDKLEKAVEIVKDYRLSGGRGTISSWFSNSFLASSANQAEDKWTATPLHAAVYVVQYRLPRSRQDPLIYQFEVDVEENRLIRGINNNAIELLDTGTSKTARAVPARNNYESETAVRTEVRNISRKTDQSAKESIIQKARKKLSARKKKTNEIKQLPLPPAPKKRYSQSVPTGFEQPEEDPDEAFLKAMESDEELF
jgi:hypothetical protein